MITDLLDSVLEEDGEGFSPRFGVRVGDRDRVRVRVRFRVRCRLSGGSLRL